MGFTIEQLYKLAKFMCLVVLRRVYVDPSQFVLELIEKIRLVVEKIFYVVETLPISVASSESFQTYKYIQETYGNSYYYGGFEFSCTTTGSICTVKRLRFFHDALWKDIKSNVNAKTIDNAIQCATKCTLNREKYVPSRVFPAHNYLRLTKALEKHLQVCRLTNAFSTLGVLIDGETGLGKSSYLDYVAHEGLFKTVYRYDLSSMLSTPLVDIGNGLSPTDSCLIMIDELDKYLDFHMTEAKSRYQLALKDTEKPTEEALEKTLETLKYKYLYDILSILERRYAAPMVLIFCSNNFDTIFSGVNPVHFVSLSDRFMRFEFTRIGRLEFSDYIRYLNTKFVGTDLHRSEDYIKCVLDKIPGDTSLTYRQLSHIATKSGYDFESMIELSTSRPKPILALASVPTITQSIGPKADDDEDDDDEDDDEDYDEDYDEDEDGDGDDDDDSVPVATNPVEPIPLTNTPPITRAPGVQSEKVIVEYVKTKLDEVAKCKYATEKAIISDGLFDYLMDQVEFLRRHDNFRQTMIAKLAELIADEHVATGHYVEKWNLYKSRLEAM